MKMGQAPEKQKREWRQRMDQINPLNWLVKTWKSRLSGVAVKEKDEAGLVK